jgi:hypothetical protein
MEPKIVGQGVALRKLYCSKTADKFFNDKSEEDIEEIEEEESSKESQVS